MVDERRMRSLENVCTEMAVVARTLSFAVGWHWVVISSALRQFFINPERKQHLRSVYDVRLDVVSRPIL